MAIQASTISSTQTLEEFRQEFNKLQSDVSTLESGPTFTSSIAFEGATADDYETTLTVTDPTADRTVTIQNKSGTVALIGTDTLDTVKLNGTDASKTNAGDDVVLDGTDSSSTNAGSALLYEDATGDHLLNQVPFEEYFLLESSFFGSDGTQAKHFLLEQTDGDQIEVEFATSDVTLGAAFRPPAGGGPQFRTPTNDGTANQVFATDGSGNLSFVDRSSGMVLTGSTNNTVVTVTGASTGQGEANLTFDGSTLTITGAIDMSGAFDTDGVASASTFEPDGDTASGDNAAIGYTAGEGLILTGQGSTSDITVKNDADGTVFSIPTGSVNVLFPDDAKILVGAGSDLAIYHDGSHSYIKDQGTGDLKIQGAADIVIEDTSGANAAVFNVDAGQELYWRGGTSAGKKFETTQVGGTLTGTWNVTTALVPDAQDGAALGTTSLQFSDLFLADSAVIGFGDDNDTTLTHTDGTGLTLNSTNKLTFGDAASFIQQSSDGTLRIDGEAIIDLNASTRVDVSAALTAGGIIKTDDTTEATSTTDGSLQTDGGLSVVKDAVFGDDVKLLSDASVIAFGANGDVTLTHVHDTGILLNSTMAIQFNDASQYINAPSNAILDINATDEIELNATLADVNANLDVSGTGTFGGILKTDDTTEATSTTDGSLQTDGGLSVAKDVVAGDDIKLLSDASVIAFGVNGDVTLTHVHDTGILLNSTMAIQFNDASQYINAPSNAILDINATDEIELNATLADVNANLDVSGTYTGGGLMTTGGNIVIPNAGNIGSASDTDAISISSGGVVNISATTASTNSTSGALTVGGGAGIAADLGVGDDLFMISDSASITWGADSEIALTHVHNTGLSITSTAAAPLVRRGEDVFIVLDGTNSASANAGDNVIMDASAAGTDVGDDILGEDEVFLHAGMQRNVINIIGSDGKIKNSVAGFAPGAI